jgi:hypothetical protein
MLPASWPSSPPTSPAPKTKTCSTTSSPPALRRRARAPALQGETWADLLSDAVFGADAPAALRHPGRPGRMAAAGPLQVAQQPRPALSTGPTSSTARTPPPCKAAAALLHKRQPGPRRGRQPAGSLDENAHKHAFGVSEDLKYALREAIELLGNEAARQLDEQASGSKKSVFSGPVQAGPGRPQPGMPAHGLPPAVHVLHRGAARAGLCAHRQERGLPQGLQPGEPARPGDAAAQHARMRATAFTSTPPCAACSAGGQGCGFGQCGSGATSNSQAITGAKDTFAAGAAGQPPVRRRHHAAAGQGAFPQPCVATHHPPDVAHPAAGRAGAAGRVSYQLLSINQLGAVYEALLSYRGFFAAEDLYEVQARPQEGPAADR